MASRNLHYAPFKAKIEHTVKNHPGFFTQFP